MKNNLDVISENILKLPISVLTISPRIQGFLLKQNIKNIQDLVIAQKTGFENLHFIGEKSAKQIDESLQGFLHKSKEFSKEKLEELIDPRPSLLTIDDEIKPNLVTLITPFSKKLLTNLQKEREYEVIRRRYGLEGSDSYTLQEVGDYYGFTRENARQIEARGIQNIKRALYQNPDSFKWQIPDNLTQEAVTLCEIIRAGEEIQTENEIIHIIRHRYMFEITEKEINALQFLLIVFGFQPLPRRISGSNVDFRAAWHVKGEVNRNNLYQVSKSVHKLLINSVKPMSLFELTSQVNRRRQRKMTVNYIHYALKLCEQVEIAKNDLY